MSEESQNDGTMSGLLKTIIGTVGTIVTAGGAWLGSQMFGGSDQPAAQPVQQAAPVINITQQQQQAAPAGGGKTVIIKEKESAPAQPAAPKKKTEKEALQEEPKW